MAEVRWRRVAMFYGLACSGAMGLAQLALWARSAGGALGYNASLVLMMFTPTLAAIVTQRIVGEPVIPSLGITLKPNRWWAVAWLTPAVLALAALGVGLALPGTTFSPGSEGLLARIAEVVPVDQLAEAEAQLAAMGSWLLPISLIGGLVAGATVNAIAALGEEAGWRGWLHTELAPLGFWPASLITGGLWGLWHAPVILQGYNYPDHPQIGVGMMIAMCMAVSPVMALIRIRSGSTLSAALFHGVFNGTSGVALMSIAGGSDLLLGVTGASGILVYSAVCLGIAGSGLPMTGPAGAERPRP